MATNELKRTAAETYAARRTDIARLVDVLEMELEKYDQRAAAEPQRWDFPGTLDYVRTTLIDLVEGLSGMERRRIEEFLAE
ncbi:MAG: hypothetical protein IPM64_10610 [Phycisphaerales bacterium]|nr:hypothetical protein [Phycisphaerales bacterium]